jgi:hypothetical protein
VITTNEKFAGQTGQFRRKRHAGLLFFLLLLVSSLVLIAAAGWLDGSDAWRHPLLWLATLGQTEALSLLSGAAQVLAGVLAILVTVVAIVLELSATRYTHRVTALFVRDPVNLTVMAFFVLTTTLCIWLAVVLTGEVGSAPLIPRSGFLLAMIMMTGCLLVLLPYFAYVFRFVSPHSVISRIRAEALARIGRAHTGDAGAAKYAVINAMEDIEDVARGAMKNSDRGIAMAAVEALATLLTDVTKLREKLPDAWFRVDEAVARDPDFIAMAPIAIAEVARDRSWFEAKILRQYLALFGDAVGSARDVASMIAIHTRRLAEEFAMRPAFLELCQRAFHSYLRAAINAADPRTAYFVLHQYRVLGEALLAKGLQPAVFEVADRIRFYGSLANRKGLPFLLEVAAYDLAQLVEAAADNRAMRDKLLDGLLTVGHEGGAEHLLGVCRAQMQLATFFLLRGEEEQARRIAQNLAVDRRPLLSATRDELERETSPSYWEINDRGANFAYLPPERRAKLDAFFAMVRALQ